MVRHIPALAFLPANEIPAAFDILKNNMRDEAAGLMQWFETYYVHGRVRRTMRNGNVLRNNPLFPPDLWSITDNIDHALPRTQNTVEAWHRRWDELLGNTHVGIFKIINEIQREQNRVQLDIELILRGVPRPIQKRSNRQHEARIQTVYSNRTTTPLMDYLRAMAHNISF